MGLVVNHKEIEEVIEIEAITLDELTTTDWQDIRVLATKHYHAGAFGGNQGKCWILGFTEFLQFKKKALIFDDGDIAASRVH